jgi:DNA repair protein RecO (recombination protein O)
MANIIKTKGIVLKTMPFKESSLFASILTEDYGKIKVLAKGCRRPKSKLCGALEPFNLDEIIFYKRESKEIYTLSDASTLNDFEKIRQYPAKVNATLVLCEFFEKTMPAEEKDERSFSLLLRFLKEIQGAEESSIKAVTYYYLLRALALVGIRPHLENCVRCHGAIRYKNKKSDFSISAGGIVCDKHYDDTVAFLSNETIGTLKAIYGGHTRRMGRNSLDEIEKIIPDYLYYHMNNLILHSLKQLR